VNVASQTQVARVLPRYEAWLERWPAAAALAAAPPADVLAAWVGLGYNRRALRLREACQVVARGGWPEDLTRLPGVGPYTAAALGAFAFGRDEVAMDTNLRRVLARTGGAHQPVAGARRGVQPRGHGPLRHGLHRPSAALRPVSAARLVPFARRRGDPRPRRRRGRRVRILFEDTDRHARGRVVAALAARSPLPQGLGEQRLALALAGLERDGLVERAPHGWALPR